MRWNFVTFLSLVQLNHLLRVDRQALVRINDDTEEPRVGLQEIISCIVQTLTVMHQIYLNITYNSKKMVKDQVARLIRLGQ